MTTAFDLLHDIVGNGHRATRHAPMTATGKAKYYTVHEKLSDDQIAAHLLGQATYAIPLIGTDELASAGLIEQDAGGIDMARRILQAAAARSVTMFAIVCPGADGHDGCHAWARYDGRYDPAAIRAQLKQIAIDAGASTDEIHPNNTNIRLPFGLHLRTNTRGRALLQSGELFENDTELDAAEMAVAALPLNGAPPEMPLKESKNSPYIIRTVLTNRTTTGRTSLADVRTQFNADHTWPELLEAKGGAETRDGWACNCGVQHSHGTQIAITSQDKIVSYSPNCRWAPHFRSGHANDKFAFYVEQWHNGNVVDALKTLNPIERHRCDNIPPILEPEPRRSQAERDAYNAVRREKRHADNRAALSGLYDYVNTLNLPDRALLLFSYIHQIADDAGVLQVRPTNAQIEAAIGLGERSIQRAFSDLAAANLGVRRGGRSHADRPNEAATFTFNRFAIPRVTVANTADDHYVNTVTLGYIASDLIPNVELVSAAPPQQPEAWELWQPCDSEACGYDLALDLMPNLAQGEPIEAAPAASDAELPGNDPAPAAEPDLAPEGVSKLITPQPAEHPGGASYDPHRDITQPRRSRGRPPTERDAYAKSRRQARFKAMDAPTLRREWIILSRKADKTPNPAQRYALKEQVAEIAHYLALKDAELDRAILGNSQDALPPVMPAPHKLAPQAPVTLAMDLSQASYSSIGIADRLRQARDAYHDRQAVRP
jgi:hypothetical protein